MRSSRNSGREISINVIASEIYLIFPATQMYGQQLIVIQWQDKLSEWQIHPVCTLCRSVVGRNRAGGLAYFLCLKIEFICAIMGKHAHLHWLFWMDTAALFMNIHISLAQLLAGVGKDDLMKLQ